MTSRSERPFWRDRDDAGRQLVIIDRYTWAWQGDADLAVGDRVELPGNNWTNWRPYSGTVEEIGSDYSGHVRTITRRCESGEDMPEFDDVAAW